MIHRLEAEATEWLAEIDRRRSFETSGHLSTNSWLTSRIGDGAGPAATRVRIARLIGQMPHTRRSFAAGELDLDRVRRLAALREVDETLFQRDEQILVDTAERLSGRNLRRAFDYWKQAADHAGAIRDAERAHQRRRLSVSQVFDGMVRLDGDLAAEDGEVVITALRSLTDSAGRDTDDIRTPVQRRADALVEICRDYLDHGDTPVSGGEKPHITVTVSLEALEGQAGRPCEMDETGVITPEAARRIACDAGVSRVVTRGDSEILDIGRRTRTVPAATRRALVVRDGGCIVAECDRPHRWCDAHHVRHWVDGGPTDLDNLMLLCRRHHRMVHTGVVRLPQRE
jgi:hypothetical protein